MHAGGLADRFAGSLELTNPTQFCCLPPPLPPFPRSPSPFPPSQTRNSKFIENCTSRHSMLSGANSNTHPCCLLPPLPALFRPADTHLQVYGRLHHKLPTSAPHSPRCPFLTQTRNSKFIEDCTSRHPMLSGASSITHLCCLLPPLPAPPSPTVPQTPISRFMEDFITSS